MPLPEGNPEDDEIVLGIRGTDIELKNWLEYSFNSHFLTPTDGWWFTVDGASLPKEVRRELQPGAEVFFTVNGHLQGEGKIQDVDPDASDENGWIIRLEGTDLLGDVVSSCADPTVQIKASQSLADLLLSVFEPFGFTVFELDDATDRGIMTGSLRGTRTTKAKKKKRLLKEYAIHQTKPYFGEGAFAFASRVAQRHGLWIWPSTTGGTLIVSTPDFEQDASYKLVRTLDGRSNILAGGGRRSISEQPSVIVAEGFSGSPEFGRSRNRCIGINPAIDTDNAAILDKFKDAKQANLTDMFGFAPVKVRSAKPLYLHDEESKTPEQLEYFVRREMALRLRNSLACRYTVKGHSMDDAIWTVNTVVNVRDDISDLQENLWVLSRTLRKSRTFGTLTDLELIRLHSLAF